MRLNETEVFKNRKSLDDKDGEELAESGRKILKQEQKWRKKISNTETEKNLPNMKAKSEGGLKLCIFQSSEVKERILVYLINNSVQFLKIYINYNLFKIAGKILGGKYLETGMFNPYLS